VTLDDVTIFKILKHLYSKKSLISTLAKIQFLLCEDDKFIKLKKSIFKIFIIMNYIYLLTYFQFPDMGQWQTDPKGETIATSHTIDN